MRAILAGTLLWFALLATPAWAAEPGFWSCDGKFGLCRYLNRATKQEIIPARFERGMPFSEGLAAVSTGGRFGYIDERGEVVIEPRFDYAGDFSHGLAEVLVGDKVGIINRKGEMVVSPMFQRAIPLTKDVIIAVEGTWKFEPLRGHLESYDGLVNSGLYHVTGYWIRKPDLKYIRPFDRENGGAIWARERDSDGYGLLSSSGEWIVQPQYEYAGWLMDERAIVRKPVGGALLSGAVDPKGQLVVPLQSWALSYWRNGMGVANDYQGGKQALIDTNGKLIGGRWFDRVKRAEQGDISKVLIDGRWVGLDRAGTIVANPDNGRVLANCPNGVRVISVDEKVQIIDAAGQPTTPYLFEPLVQRWTCDKPFSIQLNGLWGFVGVDGHLLNDPPAFKNLYEFVGGFAVVSDGQKWSVIDASGRIVLPKKFDKFVDRRGELFHGVIEGREVWLTATGEERPAPAKHTPSPQILDCGHGLRLAERNGLWGIANADGNDVIAPRYRAVDCFRNGIAWAAIDSRGQWCALDPTGAVPDRPACGAAHYPYFQTHSTPEAFAEDRFESSVLWSRAYLEFGSGRREVPPQWIPDGSRQSWSRYH
jgi:hypothetical protein